MPGDGQGHPGVQDVSNITTDRVYARAFRSFVQEAYDDRPAGVLRGILDEIDEALS